MFIDFFYNLILKIIKSCQSNEKYIIILMLVYIK